MDLTQIAAQFNLDLSQLAGMVSVIMVLIAAAKKLFTWMQGNTTVYVSLGLSLVLGILTNLQNGLPAALISAILMFLGTTGTFELIKKVGGK